MKSILLNSFTEFVYDYRYLFIGAALILAIYFIRNILQQYDHVRCKVYKNADKTKFVFLYVYKHKHIKNFAYYRPEGMSIKLTDQQCNDFEKSHEKNIEEGRVGKHDIPEFCMFPYEPKPEPRY